MLTQERAIKLFRYDPESGDLIRRVRVSNQLAGSIAGSIVVDKGTPRFQVKVDGRGYVAARVIWLILYGRWPEQIDHINRDPMDNRLENLREVTASENAKNRRRRSDNTVGLAGVYWQKARQRWLATIDSSGVRHNLYAGRDFFEACCRRKSAERRLGFGE